MGYDLVTVPPYPIGFGGFFLILTQGTLEGVDGTKWHQMAPNSTMTTEAQSGLSHRQHLAIAEILASPSLEEARRRVKAGKHTFYGWMKEPAFTAELVRQREAVVQQAFDRLKAGLTQAVDKLFELLSVEGQPGIQLRAAQTLLDTGFKAVEHQALERRIEALEAHLASQRTRRWR